jgi:L-rhamnose mutarotase
MIRKAFLMTLKPGNQEEYERRHNPIWPELQSVLSEHGVSNYSIFLDRDTDRLFAYAEIKSEAQWQSIAGTDVCQRWWAHMSELMLTHPDHSPVSMELLEVFHLDEKRHGGST